MINAHLKETIYLKIRNIDRLKIKGEKMRKIVFILAITVMSIFATSCIDLDDNTITPAGGIVPYTYNFTITPSQWEYSGEKNHWFTRLSVPHINEDVIDYGAVLVYFKNRYNSWVLLPFTTSFKDDSTSYNEEIWSSYFLWGVDIDYKYTHPNNATPPSTMNIKVVVLKDNWAERVYNRININNYDDLKKEMNIVE